jgi:hypothetical protein
MPMLFCRDLWRYGMPATATVRGYGDITPALTREQWAAHRAAREANGPCGCGTPSALPPIVHRTAIAMANDALESIECYKLDWDYVDKLREVAKRLLERPITGYASDEELLQDSADAGVLASFANVIASYLPPRD